MNNSIQIRNRDFPTVSVLTPTLNSGDILERCLKSIYEQDYPKGKIEVIVIDGGSVDDTLKIAESYGAVIIKNDDLRENQEQRKAIGLLNAKNDIVAFIDSDNILPHRRWLLNMVAPFQMNEEIIATQPLRYAYLKDASLLNRYFALLGVNDPVAYYLGKRDRLSWAEGDQWNLLGQARDMGTYFEVKFDSYEIPTLGANGFLAKREVMLKAECEPSKFFHIDINCDLIKLGYNTYGFVKESIIHFSAYGLKKFLYKRYSYMKRYFLKNQDIRRYKIYDRLDRGKLVKFIFFSLTLIEPIMVSVKGYRKLRDKAWFLHPLVCLAILSLYGLAIIQWHIGCIWEKDGE